MKPGDGHALFTAKRSDVHFHCIASNVKHGNQVCPICQSKLEEILFQGPAAEVAHGRSIINPLYWPRDDGWMTLAHRIPPPHPRLDSGRQFNAVYLGAGHGLGGPSPPSAPDKGNEIWVLTSSNSVFTNS
ncbi:hypothetical protein EJ110_NYTH45465 [Nymphaea thermarum]|nr:hypothetical protein EJ110_NYTH45465 [Nymphaea thermarum]